MNKLACLSAIALGAITVAAQDVVMESLSSEYNLLKLENTGTNDKLLISASSHTPYSSGIDLNLTSWTDHSYLNGFNSYVNVGNGGGAYGVTSSAYGGSGSYSMALTGYAGGGAGSHNYGVYGYAGGGSFAAAGYFQGKVYYQSLHQLSDQKFKTNVRELPDGIDKILRLRPKLYDMKVKEYEGKVRLSEGAHMGFLAQDVEEVLPELVSTAYAPAPPTKENGKSKKNAPMTEYKSLDYTGLIPVLVKAVQEQQAQIDALKAEVAELKGR